MAYGSRRSTYRRKGRRGNRTLSTRRIFNNKGAKAQAAQIYALRKSVNRVRRQCRPEVKETSSVFENRKLGQNNIAQMVNYAVVRTPTPGVGAGDWQRVGDMIRILPLKFRFTLQYREVYGTVEGSTVWNVPRLPTHGMQVRIIALQSKSSNDTTLPTPSDVLESYSDNQDYLGTSSTMVQQFKNGITSRYHILMNRVYSVSEDKPMIARTLRIKPKIASVRWESGADYPRGQMYLMFIQGGSVYRTVIADPDNLYDYNTTNIMFKMTQAYTDV